MISAGQVAQMGVWKGGMEGPARVVRMHADSQPLGEDGESWGVWRAEEDPNTGIVWCDGRQVGKMYGE